MDKTQVITEQFLKDNPNHVFVFGDNTLRKGKKGAAMLRDCPNSYGFITKKYPSFNDDAYYTIEEYKSVFNFELAKLISLIEKTKHKTFLITKLGAGLANKFGIWEGLIEKELECLKKYNNVFFLY